MRLIFFLLVLANLVFFAWTQGYLGATDDGHEPQRLAGQLNAEKVHVAPDTLAPPARQDSNACRVVDGLSVAAAETLKTALAAAGVEAKLLPPPTLYLVLITDLANKTAADKKLAELTRLGLKDQSAVGTESGTYEVVLGSFPTEPAARAFLQGLAKRGITSARVDGRPQPGLKTRVEARAPASTLQLQLPGLTAALADVSIGECAP